VQDKLVYGMSLWYFVCDKKLTLSLFCY